ncbi:MAG TPA: methyltransferase domain-containing protein, partial [Candidatus Eisenbacteria bacterium]|nr:methyltransferase domain-containing protein [Candidatus Eisenbacteria bacterium]
MPTHVRKDEELQRAFLIDCLAPKREERILDLGCGLGQELEGLLRLHPSIRVVGLDSSERMVRMSQRRLSRYVKRGRAELVVGDASKTLPFPSKHF